MRISDWSSDGCSSDLQADIAFLDQIEELQPAVRIFLGDRDHEAQVRLDHFLLGDARFALALLDHVHDAAEFGQAHACRLRDFRNLDTDAVDRAGFIFGEGGRSEEHTSEIQSLMSISYDVFCLKKK